MPRRLALALACGLHACGPAVDAAPETREVAPPAPPQVRADDPPAPPAAPKDSTTKPGEPAFHLAASADRTRSRQDLTLVPLTDGGLAVLGERELAVAAAGSGALQRDAAWPEVFTLAGFALDFEITGIGGAWPGPMYATLQLDDYRSSGSHKMFTRKDGKWSLLELPAPRGMVSFYLAYGNAPGGRLLGLRVLEPRSFDTEEDWMPRKLSRPALDLLIGEWAPLPALPKTARVRSPQGGPDAVFMLLRGPAVLRATPGGARWDTLPDLGHKADGFYTRPGMLVGPSGRAYLYECPDESSSKGYLHRFEDGKWSALTTPGGECVWSLDEAPDGTLRTAKDGKLHQHRPDGTWEAVPVRVELAGKLRDLTVATALSRPDGALWLLGSLDEVPVAATTLAVPAAYTFPPPPPRSE